ncbi:HHR119Cp [Eremothecium sinecaudum]|uniref:HHR119Cp n=1 Tax=Eremothecium sinecaudum TaxID=45286 RepID=A0A109V0I2_9SACH|nr:HHR119Cp [Eremothecium sinecaudum]AMD22888.1 HHR119Cp [Eremothecium sinecaudum]
MKLKLVVNSSNEDYKLFKTTIMTMAQLRKTAILRFTTDRLIVVSTPKTVSSGAVLSGDQGQLWCTIPKDVFSLYNVTSIREENTIAMECQCDSLMNVLKRYDRCTHGDLTIKLQSMPEWNQNHPNNLTVNDGNNSGSQGNPICALGCTFNEYLGLEDNSKTVWHSFKVGVRLLYKTQDSKIQEPTVNYNKLLMFRLPPVSGEYGAKFSEFIKRLDRYATLNHILLHGESNEGAQYEGQLRLLVHELSWKLDIQWRGPLETITQGNEEQREQPNEQSLQNTTSRKNSMAAHGNSMQIEDSELDLEPDQISLSRIETPAPSEKTDRLNRVFIKAKDWKVCSRLYDSFEEVVLAISHDESCVLHCSLDRGLEDDQSQRPKERGQIIYYMARSKLL